MLHEDSLLMSAPVCLISYPQPLSLHKIQFTSSPHINISTFPTCREMSFLFTSNLPPCLKNPAYFLTLFNCTGAHVVSKREKMRIDLREITPLHLDYFPCAQPIPCLIELLSSRLSRRPCQPIENNLPGTGNNFNKPFIPPRDRLLRGATS